MLNIIFRAPKLILNNFKVFNVANRVRKVKTTKNFHK